MTKTILLQPISPEISDHQAIRTLLRYPWVYHTTFWIIYYLLSAISVGFSHGDYDYAFYLYGVRMPFYLLFCYLIWYWLFPAFFSQRKYNWFVFNLISLVVVAVVLMQACSNYLVEADYCPTMFRERGIFNIKNVSAQFIPAFALAFLVTGLKLTKDWFLYQQKIKEIEKQNLKNELDFLKSQLQPHFLFNTLNNLYALTLKKSELAPEIVLKLSDLMAYMLYESDNQRVLLTKELMYIQHYLDLETLRFGDRLEIDLEISGNIEGKSVAPLLLLPFVENSFKHGVSSQLDKIQIEIKLHATNHKLIFEVKNPFLKKQNHLQRPVRQGVGLKNVRRRLELLYADNFHLQVTEEGEQYKVVLEVPFW